MVQEDMRDLLVSSRTIVSNIILDLTVFLSFMLLLVHVSLKM